MLGLRPLRKQRQERVRRRSQSSENLQSLHSLTHPPHTHTHTHKSVRIVLFTCSPNDDRRSSKLPPSKTLSLSTGESLGRKSVEKTERVQPDGGGAEREREKREREEGGGSPGCPGLKKSVRGIVPGSLPRTPGGVFPALGEKTEVAGDGGRQVGNSAGDVYSAPSEETSQALRPEETRG